MNDRPDDNLPLGPTHSDDVEPRVEIVDEVAVLDERRRRRGATIAAAAFLTILLVIVLVQAALSDDGDDDLPDGVDPDVLTMQFDMLDGSTTSLDQLEGRPVVVNFFASWCAPCVREMPAFEDVHAELGDAVVILGVNTRDTPDELRELLDDTGITYDVGLDPRGDLVTAFGGTVMPTTVFITADGRVVEVHGGELDGEEIRRMIDQEFAT